MEKISSKIAAIQFTNEEIQGELKKFFSLFIKLQKPIAMFSELIDDEWHRMLQDKVKYNQFCLENFGVVINHCDKSIPGTSGYGLIEWIPFYELEFGKLHSSWFKDINGELDEQLYENYLSSGQIVASWSCTPSSGS